jgi:hypothetical protein
MDILAPSFIFFPLGKLRLAKVLAQLTEKNQPWLRYIWVDFLQLFSGEAK